MRSARYAGLVAGAVLLQGFAVFAGEGSSLRGLIAPGVDVDNPALYALTGRPAGLKRSADDTLPISPRLFLSGGTFETRRFITGDSDFRFGLHQPTGQNVAALSEPSVHTLQDVLPRYTAYTQLTHALPRPNTISRARISFRSRPSALSATSAAPIRCTPAGPKARRSARRIVSK
jgi:hypothetical protein